VHHLTYVRVFAALTRSALLTADLVLVPVQTPPFVRAAFAETLRLVNEASTFRPQLRTRSFSTTAATCAPSMPVRLHERSPTLICRC
jgi:cellulose biosynthesis protein BcsQ